MKAILLVPSAEWRERLLIDGACGARPPIASKVPDYSEPSGWRWEAGDKRGTPTDIAALALVLAFDGHTIPEGCDVAVRALSAADPHGRHEQRMWPTYTLPAAANIATDCAVRGLGEVITLPAGEEAPCTTT